MVLPLALAGLVVVAAPRLLQPSTLALVQAVGELGPISGWRCAQSGTYIYDPRRERPDTTLLAEPPEEHLRSTVPDVEVERVEADLEGGDTVVWSRVATSAGGTSQRVFVLSPGRSRTILRDHANNDAGRLTICNSHLGDWHIVGEHDLGFP